jgi:hypothetical protein
MAVLGFALYGPDNDSYMIGAGDAFPACAACGRLTDPYWVNPAFRLRRPHLDISYTYDGFMIVSEEFRALSAAEGVQFVAVPMTPRHFHLVVEPIVAFDAERRHTRFDDWCEGCNRFNLTIGATPPFIRENQRLSDRLYRTDLEFGEGNRMHPMILMGPDLAARIRAADLSGTDLTAIKSLEAD